MGELDEALCSLQPGESITLRCCPELSPEGEREFFIDTESESKGRTLMYGTSASCQNCMTPPDQAEQIREMLTELRKGPDHE